MNHSYGHMPDVCYSQYAASSTQAADICILRSCIEPPYLIVLLLCLARRSALARAEALLRLPVLAPRLCQLVFLRTAAALRASALHAALRSPSVAGSALVGMQEPMSSLLMVARWRIQWMGHASSTVRGCKAGKKAPREQTTSPPRQP